jgi:hypothetical protein
LFAVDFVSSPAPSLSSRSAVGVQPLFPSSPEDFFLRTRVEKRSRPASLPAPARTVPAAEDARQYRLGETGTTTSVSRELTGTLLKAVFGH